MDFQAMAGLIPDLFMLEPSEDKIYPRYFLLKNCIPSLPPPFNLPKNLVTNSNLMKPLHLFVNNKYMDDSKFILNCIKLPV